jgi:hypothetical protein
MRILGHDITIRKAGRNQSSRRVEGSNVQTREVYVSPYQNALRQQVPLNADLKLYRMLREAIPCLDVAVDKLVRLIGFPEIVADEPLKTEIEAWMKGVRCPPLQTGLNSWFVNHVDSMLWSGKAVSEIVPTNNRKDIYALVNIDPETIVYQVVPDDPLSLNVAQKQNGKPEPVVLDADWIAVNLYNPGTNPHGRSLYASLPFVSEVLMTMYTGLRNTWDRFGTPTYNVRINLPNDFVDPAGSKIREMMGKVEKSFVEAMEARKAGQIRDFFSANIDVSVIGAEGETLNFSTPYRDIMEQIAGKTGLPPWMLGFTWSSTERLSSNQVDMLTSTIDSIWDELYPDVYRIIQRWMLLTGRRGEFDIIRNAVSLQDALDTARAEQISALAEKTRQEVGWKLWTTGVYTQEQYAEHILGEDWDGQIAVPMTEPPAMPSPAGNDEGQNNNSVSLSAKHSHIHTADCSCGELYRDADAQVSYGNGEQPKDRRIAEAIDGMYGDMKAAITVLRDKAWQIFDLPDPMLENSANKADGDPFSYTPEQEAAFDRAIEQFLTTMAGKYRDKIGFTAQDSGDGVIQQWERFAHSLGVGRAVEMTGAEAAMVLPGRNSTAITDLMNNAFDRLSDNGRLRLETSLGGLKDIIREGMDLGQNPIAVAREMSGRFDSYAGWEFQRLARTEISFAQNAGLIDEFNAEGVDMSRIDINAFPAHPNCLCSYTIELGQDGKWYMVYDIAIQACSICQAYAGRG